MTFKRASMAKLRWARGIDGTDIAVAVNGGVTALIGLVQSYHQR
jgi:osmotically-inducible protein OsmY